MSLVTHPLPRISAKPTAISRAAAAYAIEIHPSVIPPTTNAALQPWIYRMSAKSLRENERLKSFILATMRLFSIEVIIEAEDQADAESVQDAIGRAICPHPPQSDHRCPRGWMTMSHELDDEEAAAWSAPDALNR